MKIRLEIKENIKSRRNSFKMKDNIVYDSKYWIIKLSDDQYCLGRCVVLLKRPCQHLSEISEEEATNLFEIIKKLENGFLKIFGANMFNWTCLMNDFYKKLRYNENKDDPQVHLHFRPRYKNKVEFAGEVFIDEEFAHHYKRKSDKKVSDEVMKKIAKKIREAIK